MPQLKKPIAAPATTNLLAVKRQGLPLLSIKAKVIAVRAPKTQEQYEDADQLLGQVSVALKKWDAMIEPILGPLKRAEREIKSAMAGSKALDKEIRTPLEEMSDMLRAGMKSFKVEEQRQIQEQQREREQIQRELERQQEVAATAPRAQTRQKAEQNIAAIESRLESDPEIIPTSGIFSGTRSKRAWRVVNADEFYTAVAANDIPREAAPVDAVYMNRMFKEHGEALGTWPGVEIFDDIIIAKRS